MIGKTLGHYRVGEQLGHGGMGEVYVAADLSLDRKVALKFLPEAFAADPERMTRFEREAKVLASLNHPNIAGIYGLEQAEGKRFIVMELVEGETLAQRLSKGGLPVDEALGICKQIAEGLEAAHEKGVIHRDLKPANVMITEGDKVKILDFGLAKALSDETQSADSSHSPTLTEAMTRPGVILGTAAYMSPEQAKGKSIDKRADIWAFGCILYECLTGKKAFEGETVTEMLAALLKSEPDWQALPATAPPGIRFVLSRCLEKDVHRRFQNAADVRILIEELPQTGESPPTVTVRRPWLPWSVAAFAILIALALGFLLANRNPVPHADVVRFQIGWPERTFPAGLHGLALSPDGRHLAFAAVSNERFGYWLRPFDSLEARPLPGPKANWLPPPFWSPDSRLIAFGDDGKLMKMDFSGGPPLTICDISSMAAGGSWNRDGVIIYGDYGGSMGIARVSENGGTPTLLTRPDPERGETFHMYPAFLPDGRHFVYFRGGSPKNAGIYLGSLDSKPEEQRRTRLLAATSAAVYAPSRNEGSGQLLFLRNQTLMAQPFDEKRLEPTGEPKAIAEGIGSYYQYGTFSASTNGILVWRSGTSAHTRFTWIDRSGRKLGTAGEPGDYPTFDLSKDGARLVVSKGDLGLQNLWTLDLKRDSVARLTKDETENVDPRWSPDGSSVIFGSNRDPSRSPFQVSLSDLRQEQVFKYAGRIFSLDDWSPDGSHLLYHGANLPELWAVPLSGDRKPVLVTRSLEGYVDQAQFSPDGRWIAYNTNESGRHEVKVVSFPQGSQKSTISKSGGAQPTWGRDGRELYFLAPDGTLMVVDVRLGTKFEWGDPRPLFPTGLSGVSTDTEQYAPYPDGNRFLFAIPSEKNLVSPFTITLNWTSLLKK